MVLLEKKELEMKLKLHQAISYSHLRGTIFYKIVLKICRLKFTYSFSLHVCRSLAKALSPPCQPTNTSLPFHRLLTLTLFFRYVTGWFSPYHRKRKIIHPIIMHHFQPDAVR